MYLYHEYAPKQAEQKKAVETLASVLITPSDPFSFKAYSKVLGAGSTIGLDFTPTKGVNIYIIKGLDQYLAWKKARVESSIERPTLPFFESLPDNGSSGEILIEQSDQYYIVISAPKGGESSDIKIKTSSPSYEHAQPGLHVPGLVRACDLQSIDSSNLCHFNSISSPSYILITTLPEFFARVEGLDDDLPTLEDETLELRFQVGQKSNYLNNGAGRHGKQRLYLMVVSATFVVILAVILIAFACFRKSLIARAEAVINAQREAGGGSEYPGTMSWEMRVLDHRAQLLALMGQQSVASLEVNEWDGEALPAYEPLKEPLENEGVV